MARHEVEFRILGPFEVAASGVVVPVGSRQQRLVLALLVVELNRVVSTERLLDAVWGDARPATAETTLRGLISRLRRLLTELDASGEESRPRITSRQGGYVLEADPACVDARRFTQAVAAASEQFHAGFAAEAARSLSVALDLWRGEALGDLPDADFARLEATRLEELRLGAVESLAEAELAAGRPGAAQNALERLLAAHPLREAAWARLILALYRQGRQADALRAYQRARLVLADQLGLEPGPELRRLERRILEHDPSLDTLVPERHGVAPGAAPETVAFLFTDIEASTRRWEGDQTGMAADLARHDELLRGVIERTGGRVFNHTGDGLCASFVTAAAAVAAAVEGQALLQNEIWHSSEPLRVRMAVGAGAAEARGGNWVGQPLNRTARLLALATGGQILCSLAAADLARDSLPPDVTLRDLGQHALADLARPEQVFQVQHPKLPSGFPPLRSTVTARGNLPTRLSPFLGRASELDEIETLLDSTRLLTLTGVGGVGKTRLAVEVARRLAGRYPDGVWWADLTSTRDDKGVVEALCGALGLLGAHDDRLERLSQWLAARKLLLVVDNCEHVIDAVVETLEELLPGAPGVTVLATSREILALPGEAAWSVPPMSLPPERPERAAALSGSDAVALFCQRATSTHPAFGLSDANAPAVARICRRLDGIPLALELAAARVRTLGAAELAERLDDRFRLLTATTRGTVPRHQTLQAAMDWSWNLLPAAEQAALRRLSVFPESFTLEAAETVVAGPEPPAPGFAAFDLVARLVDKSLVIAMTTHEATRYRLLETVRSYAADQLARAGEADSAQQAHCDFFLRLADHLQASFYWNLERNFDAIVANEADLRCALEWCLATGRRDETLRLIAVYWVFAMWAARVDLGPLLSACLADPLPEPSPPLVESLIGWSLHMRDAPTMTAAADCAARLEQALAMAERLGDPSAVARVRVFLGETYLVLGRSEMAAETLTSARDHHRSLGLFLGQAWCEHALGWLAMAKGHHEEARRCFERGLGVPTLDGYLTVHLDAGLAAAGAAAGDEEFALANAESAIARARSLPLPGFLVMALTRAAEAALMVGRHDVALSSTRELLVLLRDLGIRRWVAGALELALALGTAGDTDDATRGAGILGAAAAIRHALGENANPIVLVAERLDQRRREFADLLGEERRAREIERGRRASTDEALRWAAAALARTCT